MGYKKKFSATEMTSNAGGKTSASGTMGIIVILAGILGFLLSVGLLVFTDSKMIDLVYQSIIVISIGAGLLGYRKSKTATAELTELKKEING